MNIHALRGVFLLGGIMKNNDFFNVRYLVESGIMIALAVILDMITIYKLPNGGSITLASMLPIVFIAVRWGLARGLITGLLFGVVQMILSPYVYSIMQGLLDYPIAFMFIGVSGLTLYKNNREKFEGFIPFIILAFFLRFLAHFVSGIVFFASDPNSIPASALFSLQYNASYMAPELIITLVLLGILWKPLGRILKKQY